MKILASAIAILTVATLSMASGCKSDDEHGHTGDGGHVSQYPSCQAIIDRCHPLDVGDPGPINDCHALAHENATEEKCAAKKAECEKTCVPGAADSGADTGTQDAPTGG